ncbi:coiled-coil domain-containing protein 39 [Stigmatopora nigra]
MAAFAAQALEKGWEQHYALPILNGENKELINEIIGIKRELVRLKNVRETNKEKRQLGNDCLKNVKKELDVTEALCTAKERECTLERDLGAVAEREKGRLQQENTKMENDILNLDEKYKYFEINIVKAREKLEKFRAQMNWDQRALEAFLEESAIKDEDTMAIVKYSHQDEKRIKSLTMALERMTVEASKKRKILDKEMTETLAAQIALDKSMGSLQQAHVETEQIIHQWEKTIQQMKQRDQDMHQCALKLAESNQIIRERNDTLTELINRQESQMNDNKEKEKKLAAGNRQAAKLRLQFKQEEKNFFEMQEEVKTCKALLDRTTSNVHSTRSHIQRMKEEIQNNDEKLAQSIAKNVALDSKLKWVTQNASSEKERAAQMEIFLKEEEQAIKELENQLRERSKELVRCQQNGEDYKRKEKNFMAHIIRSKCTINTLETQLRKQEEYLVKQMMIMNEKDSQLIILDKKLARLQGVVGDSDEKIEMESKIVELLNTLEETKKMSGKMLVKIKESEEDIRYLKKEKDDSASLKEELYNKVSEQKLINNNMEKELKKLRLKKQDHIVEQNISKLEVKRKRDLLFNKANSVVSLEKRQLNVRKAIQERQEEIRVYTQMLKQQLKTTDQERQRIKQELNLKVHKVEASKKHYEVVTFSMAAQENDDDDAVKCQAHYIAKSALEKAELTQKGMCLDNKIRKAQRENKALENTTLLFHISNTGFSTTVSKAKEATPDYQEKYKLEEQIVLAEEKLATKREALEKLRHCLQDINITLKDRLQAKQELEKEVRDIMEFNDSVDEMLITAIKFKPHLQSTLEQHFSQANLHFPSRPGVSAPVSRRSNLVSSSVSARHAAFSVNTQRLSDESDQSVKTVILGQDLP